PVRRRRWLRIKLNEMVDLDVFLDKSKRKKDRRQSPHCRRPKCPSLLPRRQDKGSLGCKTRLRKYCSTIIEIVNHSTGAGSRSQLWRANKLDTLTSQARARTIMNTRLAALFPQGTSHGQS